MKFEQMTQDMLNHLLPGQRAFQDQLSGADSAGGSEIETVTSGALSATMPVSYLSVTGSQAYTLPNGMTKGQRKLIYCTVAATIPAGTLTITTPSAVTGFVLSSTFFFDTVGQGLELYWDGVAWNGLRVLRAGGAANNVVVGTTTINTSPVKNLWKTYNLSITGSQASSTTKGIPDGNAPGEIICVYVTNAASIPSGTITLSGTVPGSGVAKLGGTGTLGTATATTHFATLVWDTTAGWTMLAGSTLTIT
jgi:hypothetical protein